MLLIIGDRGIEDAGIARTPAAFLKGLLPLRQYGSARISHRSNIFAQAPRCCKRFAHEAGG